MKKRVIAMLIAGVTVLSAAACGAKEEPDSRDGVREEAESEEDEKEDAAESDGEDTGAVDPEETEIADRLCGDWQYVCMESGYKEGDYEATGFEMQEDNEYIRQNISFYYDGDELYADYLYSEYEYGINAFHLPVTLEKGALYDGCKNTEWYVRAQHPAKEEIGFSATLTGENELTEYEEHMMSYDSGDACYTYITTYLREGSNEASNASDYRYFTTVEVSTVDELVAAIADHTKIILDPGVYNLSELQQRRETENFKFDADGEPYLTDLEHLKLEAKDGGYVEICTDSANASVLDLESSSFISLEGLTVGHRVPPGGCCGSVLYAGDVYTLNVDNCKLYGSGTYGLSACNSNMISVNRSEIFECTFGIADLSCCYNVSFNRCDLHDNADSEMFFLYGCADVNVTDCELKNNHTDLNYGCFVGVYGDCFRIGFERCNFAGNSYRAFCDSDIVTTQGCKFSDL